MAARKNYTEFDPFLPFPPLHVHSSSDDATGIDFLSFSFSLVGEEE